MRSVGSSLTAALCWVGEKKLLFSYIQIAPRSFGSVIELRSQSASIVTVPESPKSLWLSLLSHSVPTTTIPQQTNNDHMDPHIPPQLHTVYSLFRLPVQINTNIPHATTPPSLCQFSHLTTIKEWDTMHLDFGWSSSLLISLSPSRVKQKGRSWKVYGQLSPNRKTISAPSSIRNLPTQFATLLSSQTNPPPPTIKPQYIRNKQNKKMKSNTSHCKKFKGLYIALSLAMIITGATIGVFAWKKVGIFKKPTPQVSSPPPPSPIGKSPSSLSLSLSLSLFMHSFSNAQTPLSRRRKRTEEKQSKMNRLLCGTLSNKNLKKKEKK